MPTITAQIIIGHGRAETSGLQPSHYLFLSEEGRPAWIMVPENIAKADAEGRPYKIVWIPTEEDTLEDGLLMIACHVLSHAEVVVMAKEVFRNPDLAGLQLLKQVKPEFRRRLYDRCRALNYHAKALMTVMEGSCLNKQLGVLADYRLDVDVCVPRYSRYYSHLEGAMVTKGFLLSRD